MMNKKILLLVVLSLITGFVAAYAVQHWLLSGHDSRPSSEDKNSAPRQADTFANPFRSRQDTTENGRLQKMENDIAALSQKLQQIESTLQQITASESTASTASVAGIITNNPLTATFSQRLYTIDQLLKGGLDAALAEDIVRRKNSIELKRLELQDRARREGYLNSQQYYDELAELNSQDIDLRDELGDEVYDDYLYQSKQNNRIKINSVMLGSAAEQAGILSGDIVLSYDNRRLFLWQELQEATAEGRLGEYVSISIYRDGQIFSFSVPRGPLGIQLGATRLEP